MPANNGTYGTPFGVRASHDCREGWNKVVILIDKWPCSANALIAAHNLTYLYIHNNREQA